MKRKQQDVPLCLSLLLAVSCACGGDHNCPTCDTPPPTPLPPGSRQEIHGSGAPWKVGNCAGHKVGIPLRSPERPGGPLSGVVDAEVKWSPAAHVDVYLLDLVYPRPVIHCDIYGGSTHCPDGVAFDLDPVKNPKTLSYNTNQAKNDPMNITLLMCNRGPADTTVSSSVGFTPIL